MSLSFSHVGGNRSRQTRGPAAVDTSGNALYELLGDQSGREGLTAAGFADDDHVALRLKNVELFSAIFHGKPCTATTRRSRTCMTSG